MKRIFVIYRYIENQCVRSSDKIIAGKVESNLIYLSKCKTFTKVLKRKYLKNCSPGLAHFQWHPNFDNDFYNLEIRLYK